MGVYGNFLTAFPELHRRITMWTNKDKSDIRTIRALLIDDCEDGIRRKKFTSGNTALDLYDDAVLYVGKKYISQVDVGDYFEHPDKHYMMRVCHDRGYDFAAGYNAYSVEKVGGSTPDQKEELPVKEAYFA